MSSTPRSVITIRRPTKWPGTSWRSFVVRIDGRRAGRVRPGRVGEFPVEPGQHTVSVWMDWFVSPPRNVVVEPGSNAELVIGGRPGGGAIWKSFVPMLVVVFLAEGLAGGVREAGWIGDSRWTWFLVYAGLFALMYWLYVLLTRLVIRDYWTMFTLEPAGVPNSTAG